MVAGSSMGGLWALWLALDRPSRVSAVVQLGAPAGMLSDRLPPIFGPLSVPWIARAMRRLDPPSPASTRRMFRMIGDPPDQLSDAFVAAFAASSCATWTTGTGDLPWLQDTAAVAAAVEWFIGERREH